MVDLNSIQNYQAFARENMIAPNSFETIVDLRAKHSTFMLGGEITTVMTPSPAPYVWVPTSTDSDDGSSTIKPTDLLTTDPGRWKRLNTSDVFGRDILHFGSAGIEASTALVAGGTTDSVADGVNIDVEMSAPGVIDALRARASNAPGSGNSFDFQITKNGAPVGATTSIANVATSATGSPGVTFVAGDRIGVNVTAVSGPAAANGIVDLGIHYTA